MSPITFRAATQQDAESSVALWWPMQHQHLAYDAAYEHTDAEACRMQWLKHFAELLGQPATRIYVAQAGDELIGMIIAHLVDRPPIYRAQRMVEVEVAVVAMQWRHQGIFRQLLSMVEQYARDSGASLVTLCVDIANPASNAYQHSGFTPRMTHMQKWIGNPPTTPPPSASPNAAGLR